MAKKPVLVVMAAGMGSRYGGLKQIDPVGSKGEAILDYSIYDAHQAGFETVVIIIKEAIKNDFMETVGARLKNAPVEIRYAYQELEKLPEGYSIPEGRTKPFGTGSSRSSSLHLRSHTVRQSLRLPALTIVIRSSPAVQVSSEKFTSSSLLIRRV